MAKTNKQKNPIIEHIGEDYVNVIYYDRTDNEPSEYELPLIVADIIETFNRNKGFSQSEVDEINKEHDAELRCREVEFNNRFNLLRKEFEDDLVYVGSDIKKIISSHGLVEDKDLRITNTFDKPSKPDKFNPLIEGKLFSKAFNDARNFKPNKILCPECKREQFIYHTDTSPDEICPKCNGSGIKED